MEQEQKDTLNWLEETLALCTELGRESRETVWIRERFEDVARSQNLSGRGGRRKKVPSSYPFDTGAPGGTNPRAGSNAWPWGGLWRWMRQTPPSSCRATTTALIGFSLPPTIRTRSTAGAEAIWKLWRPNTWPRSTRWNWSD